MNLVRLLLSGLVEALKVWRIRQQNLLSREWLETEEKVHELANNIIELERRAAPADRPRIEQLRAQLKAAKKFRGELHDALRSADPAAEAGNGD